MTRNGWTQTPLAQIITRTDESVTLDATTQYREVTVKLWGKGVVLRGLANGSEIAAERRGLVRKGQFLLSRIDARNGACGLVPESLDGAVVSSDFPAFSVDRTKLLPEYFGWLARTEGFVDLCREASEGTTNRVRLQEDRFLALSVALPPLAEQRRIVARIEELAAKIEEARGLQNDLGTLLGAAYHRIADGAPERPLADVAPLVRRPVTVKTSESYPQVSVRSFGRGAFHKPPLIGSDVTWEKPFLVRSGDVLISNIKAWEGALAVAGPADDGRVCSHRYLTCVPINGIATSRFVCFHLLSARGLFNIGEASPGSADRNRTLSMKALMKIQIPVPEYARQLWFDSLCHHADRIAAIRAETSAALDALLPSILDKAFKGEL